MAAFPSLSLPLLDRATEMLQRWLRPKPASETFGPEMGWGGAKISAGISIDEHVQDLKGRAGIQMAAKMRRSDATVRATEKIVSLPIRATSWMIEAPDQAGSAEKEAAELLTQNLFGGMEGSFDDLLREGTLAIYYGCRAPEIVWEERAGVVAIAKVASRNPELMEAWLHDDAGRLAGYLYAGDRPIGTGLTTSNVGMTRYERVAVPIEKTIRFSYDEENENPSGFGLWRSMYQHWYIKSALYKIVSIGLERNLLDVPVGRLQEGAQNDERTKFLRILQRWRAAEDAAVVLQHGQELEFVGSQRSLMDAMPYLQHHDTKILQSGLASFLNLGQSSSGTQALGSVLGKIFETAEDANARWIEQSVQQQLVRRWALLNYGPKLRSPILRHRPLNSQDIGSLSQALNTLMSTGLMHATPDDEEYLRDLIEFPPIPKEQLAARRDLTTETRSPERGDHGGGEDGADERGGGAVKAAERERIDLDREPGEVQFADSGGDDATAELQARVRVEGEFGERAAALLETVQTQYLAALKPLVEKAQSNPKISQGVPLPDLASVAIPGAAKYEAFVRTYLREVFDAGRQVLAEETGQKTDTQVISNRLRSWIRARAAVIAADHLGQLRTAVLTRVLTGIRAEMETSLIFSEAGALALEELSRNTAADWGAAAAELMALV